MSNNNNNNRNRSNYPINYSSANHSSSFRDRNNSNINNNNNSDNNNRKGKRDYYDQSQSRDHSNRSYESERQNESGRRKEDESGYYNQNKKSRYTINEALNYSPQPLTFVNPSLPPAPSFIPPPASIVPTGVSAYEQYIYAAHASPPSSSPPVFPIPLHSSYSLAPFSEQQAQYQTQQQQQQQHQNQHHYQQQQLSPYPVPLPLSKYFYVPLTEEGKTTSILQGGILIDSNSIFTQVREEYEQMNREQKKMIVLIGKCDSNNASYSEGLQGFAQVCNAPYETSSEAYFIPLVWRCLSFVALNKLPPSFNQLGYFEPVIYEEARLAREELLNQAGFASVLYFRNQDMSNKTFGLSSSSSSSYSSTVSPLLSVSNQNLNGDLNNVNNADAAIEALKGLSNLLEKEMKSNTLNSTISSTNNSTVPIVSHSSQPPPPGTTSFLSTDADSLKRILEKMKTTQQNI